MKKGWKIEKFFSDHKKAIIPIAIVLVLAILVGVLYKGGYLKTGSKDSASEDAATSITLQDMADALPDNLEVTNVSFTGTPSEVNTEKGNYFAFTATNRNSISVTVDCYTIDDDIRSQVMTADTGKEWTIEGTVVGHNGSHIAILVTKLTAEKHQTEYTVQAVTENEGTEEAWTKYVLYADGTEASDFTGICNVCINDPDGNKDDFFFENGVYNGEANLVTEYAGDICYVSGGRVDTDFAGLADYAGTKYLFHHGRADLTYTGWYETDGTVYTVEKGVVTGQS